MGAGECKGVCEAKYDTRRMNRNAYRDGYKRCKRCTVWIKWDGTFCPCCGTRMQIYPRSRMMRQKRLDEVKRY